MSEWGELDELSPDVFSARSMCRVSPGERRARTKSEGSLIAIKSPFSRR